MIDALVHRHGVARRLANDALEQLPRLEEQLERARDPLLELPRVGVGRLLEVGPRDAPHFVHGREAVVEAGDLAVGLAGIAPGDVDAGAPLAVRERTRNVPL